MRGEVKIGGVCVRGPAVLAPLAGVTDRAFRILCREQGAGLAVTEMVSAQGLADGRERSSEYLDFDAGEHPISVQVFGSDPDVMAEGARVVSERRPDLIDVNCGCPVRKIVNRNAGAALLREPSRLSAIVKAMARAVPVPITVKMRSGWEDTDEAVAVARAAEDAGASAIAVHGRTRGESFGGRADWDVIGRVKAAVKVPVIGNGDVRDGRAALEMMAQTGCDLVMVGRWAVGNPWIFREIQRTFGGQKPCPPGAGERILTAVRHLRLSVAAKGPVRGVLGMRRTVWAYIKDIPGAAALRRDLMTEGDAEAVAGLLQSLAEATEGGDKDTEAAT